MRNIFPTERTAETQNFQFPTENETVYENPMTFIWIPVDDAKKYTLTVFDDDGFCEKIETEYNFANFPLELCAKKYYWTVETDTGLLREKMSFTVSESAVFFQILFFAFSFKNSQGQRKRTEKASFNLCPF